jgi:NADPH2:quinone reductase
MRAAVITDLGSPPSQNDHPEPLRGKGQTLLEIAAAPLNPVDIAVGSGKFLAGSPDPPYVPCVEAVGRVVESDSFAAGALVYAGMEGMGLSRDGGAAELAVAEDSGSVELPGDADPAIAASLGVAGLAAWLPLAWRAPVQAGETVLVLGATGTLGLIAVQAAKILGAGRVVAAGRRPDGLARAAAHGADETVQIDTFGTDAPQTLAAGLAEACGGDGPTLIIDPLWGEPFVAALEAAAPGARIVQLGQSAGAEAVVASGLVRGKAVDILGFTNFQVPRDVMHEALLVLVEHAQAGRITFDLERISLEDAGSAWERQARGVDTKLVLVP